MPLEMFALTAADGSALQPTATQQGDARRVHRLLQQARYKKKKWIIKHIEEKYLVNLDLFMMRFGGYDDAPNLRLRLPFLYTRTARP